jgi:hypothetical protein
MTMIPPTGFKFLYTMNSRYYTSYMKVKLSLCLNKNHAMKRYWGVGSGEWGLAPCILDLGS